MKIFVTGATGGVGKSLVPKLVAEGHTVLALARSPSAVFPEGVQLVQGSITDLEVCHNAAKESDVVVQLAFDHQQAFSGDWAGACAKDRAVIEAMCKGLVESSSSVKIFINCAGTLGLNGDKETDEPHRSEQMPRYKSTDLLNTYTSKGIRAITVRLANITFSSERPHEFISGPIPKYKELGEIPYSANNCWNSATYDDATDLYILIIQKASAKDNTLPNPVNFHALAEEAVYLKDVAEVLSRKLGLPAKEVDSSTLPATLGFFGNLMALGLPASAEWTKEVTGWKPSGKTLLEQLEEYKYE